MGFPNNGTGLRAFNADELKLIDLRCYGVKDGSHPRSQYGMRSNSVWREWRCNWDQRENAVCALLGGAGVFSGGSSDLTLSRVMPMSIPGHPKFIAIEIENIKGDGSCGKNVTHTVIDDDGRATVLPLDPMEIPTYKYARIMVRHELVYFKLAADDGVSPEYSRYVENMPSTTESQYLTVPGSMVKYRTKNGGIPENTSIPYSIGRPETTSKIGRKWNRVPRTAWEPGLPLYKRVHGDPTVGTRGYIGTVNKTPIFGRPSGTMLLLGVDEEQVGDPTADVPNGMGDFAFNLIFWWLQKTTGGGPDGIEGKGHNYFFNTTTLSYCFATKGLNWVPNGSINDGDCVFDEREHADLFNIGTV